MDNDELFNRIFDKFDKYEERLSTTCNTMTEIKTTLFDFINAVNKKEEETKNKIENRYRNMAVTFGSVTTVSVLLTISKTLGLI